MPVSKKSKSDPDFLHRTGRSVRDGFMSVVDDASDLVSSEEPTETGIITGLNVVLALVAPLPYALAGALSISNAAVNGRKVKKGTRGSTAASAPAAG